MKRGCFINKVFTNNDNNNNNNNNKYDISYVKRYPVARIFVTKYVQRKLHLTDNIYKRIQ